MKNLIIKNGIYASLVIIGVHLIYWIISDGEIDYSVGETVGYGSMILCMLFVFLGIREYRNVELNGSITFGKALGIGVLIALIPSAAFGLYDLAYVNYINPDFYDDYFQHYMNEMKASMTAAEFEMAKQDMEASKSFWTNPFLQFIVMFLTVFVIGFIVSVISSLVLKSQEQ